MLVGGIMHNKIIIYTDGAYFDIGDIGVCSYVILDSKENIIDQASFTTPKNLNSSRQIASELLGIQNALEACVARGFKNIEIYVDYVGLQHWFDGSWRIKSPIVGRIVGDLKNLIEKHGLSVNIRHVEAHSGDKWNNKVDRMCQIKYNEIMRRK